MTPKKPPAFQEVTRTMKVYDMLEQELGKRLPAAGTPSDDVVVAIVTVLLTVADRIAARTED